MKATISSEEIWYSFFFQLVDCDQASFLRSFLAPIYIPYINGKSNKQIIDNQRKLLETCTNIVKNYKFEAFEETSNKEVKQRLRTISKFICQTIECSESDSISSYLGKNRNVENYPERFIYSVFPQHSEGIFYGLQDYFTVLIKCIYDHNLFLIETALDRLETINHQTEYFHIPPYTNPGNDDLFNMVDRISYLLCAFCLLSSSHKIITNPKNGIALNNQENIFRKAQNFLEIKPMQSPDVHANDFIIKFEYFIQVCDFILNNHNVDNLTFLNTLCEQNHHVFVTGEKDLYLLHELSEKISFLKQELLQRSMGKANTDVNNIINELSLLVKIETYMQNWQK